MEGRIDSPEKFLLNCQKELTINAKINFYQVFEMLCNF